MCRKNATSARTLTSSPKARTACVLLGLIAGVIAQPATGAAAPAALRVGIESEIQGFDPLRTPVMGVATLTVARALFDTLVELDSEGHIEPALALRLEPAADLMSWTATLRPDVVFHDGTPFDAAAVAGHYSRLLDPANKCACRSFIGPIARVVAVDAHTVRFELSRPWAALPAVLGEPSVVSLIGSPRAVADTARSSSAIPSARAPLPSSSGRAAIASSCGGNRVTGGRQAPRSSGSSSAYCPTSRRARSTALRRARRDLDTEPGERVESAQREARRAGLRSVQARACSSSTHA
jgi:hypothetical protein